MYEENSVAFLCKSFFLGDATHFKVLLTGKEEKLEPSSEF
jgi:hypothetical protein